MNKIKITALANGYVRIDYGDYAQEFSLSTFLKETGKGITLSRDKTFITVNLPGFYIGKIDSETLTIIETTARTPEEYYPILEAILIG